MYIDKSINYCPIENTLLTMNNIQYEFKMCHSKLLKCPLCMYSNFRVSFLVQMCNECLTD